MRENPPGVRPNSGLVPGVSDGLALRAEYLDDDVVS